MAHKTLIGGTAYGVTGGKTLVGGTGYSIKGGKTLIDGTVYSVSFGIPWNKYSCNVTNGYVQITPSGKTGTFSYTGKTADKPSSLYEDYTFTTENGYKGGTACTKTYSYISISRPTLYRVSSTYVQSAVFSKRETLDNSTGRSRFTFNYTETAKAERTVISATKGSTSYGTVSVPEGEVPDGGTLYEGSVTGDYCIVNVGGTYYYYERA